MLAFNGKRVYLGFPRVVANVRERLLCLSASLCSSALEFHFLRVRGGHSSAQKCHRFSKGSSHETRADHPTGEKQYKNPKWDTCTKVSGTVLTPKLP